MPLIANSSFDEFAGRCFCVARSSFGQPTGVRLASTHTTAQHSSDYQCQIIDVLFEASRKARSGSRRKTRLNDQSYRTVSSFQAGARTRIDPDPRVKNQAAEASLVRQAVNFLLLR